MKLALIGGGGFRVPLVVEAAAADDAPFSLDEIALYDTDASRLAAVRAVIGAMPLNRPLDRPFDRPSERPPDRALGRPLRVTTTTDLDEALAGADFVFSSIRVGGLAGRVADERVALDRGVLGQETTGPGGLAFALRTVPVMRRLAERIRVVAPQAWLVNFTNPAGIVTEALTHVLGERVLGICDTPIGLLRRVRRILGADVTAFDYVGLNHLGWLRSVTTPGGEALGGLLADDGQLARIEEARLVGFDWVRQLGALPNEYLYYYYFTREAIARISSGTTRGEYLQASQQRFFDEAAAHPVKAHQAWLATMHEREATYMAESRPEGEEDQRDEADLGGGYQGVALATMAALASGRPAELILNVRNRLDDGGPVVPGLPVDSVVEVPCVVDGTGVHPRPLAPVGGHMLGLLQSVKAVEQLAIEAAETGSAGAAWRAFALHPLVDSVSVARDLLAGYRAAHPGLAYLS